MHQIMVRVTATVPRLIVAVGLASGLLVTSPGVGNSTAAHATPLASIRTTRAVPSFPLPAPISFQPDRDGSFLARATGATVLVGPATLRIALGSRNIQLSYLGTNPHPRIMPEGRLPGLVSYFQSRDPRRWQASLPTFARLRVPNLYPGIDLVYYTGRRGLEYDLVVHPGADPRRIQVATTGALLRPSDGDLVSRSPGSTLALAAPIIYQGTARDRLAGGYRIGPNGVVTFRVAPYDQTRTLVIDPYLKVFGTSGYNSIGGAGTAIAVDSAGNTYVTGTGSGQFPTTPGAALTSLANQDVANSAIVVMKLDPHGKLLFSTYLGTVHGNSTTDMSSAGIAVDGAGNVYITGTSDGTNFPLVHPLISFALPDGSGGGGYHDFVAKLNPTGSKVLYSTFLGGGLNSRGLAIAVDRAGNAHVAGSTSADENPDTKQFPVTAHRQPCSPGIDGTVVTINPTGSKLLAASCIGATGTTRATAIAIDQAGSIYVAGYTNIFAPKTKLRIVSDQPGLNNVFVVKYDLSQTKVLYAAFLGGTGDSQPGAIAVDRAGKAYITGSAGAQFPTTSGAFMRQSTGPSPAFVAAINPAGDHLFYSTLLGGNTADAGTGIALDTQGNAFVTGTIARNLDMAQSAGAVAFPVSRGARYTKFNSNGDGFLTELTAGGTRVLSSTLLGGLVPSGLALGPKDRPYLTGSVTRQDPQIPEAKDTWFEVWAL